MTTGTAMIPRRSLGYLLGMNSLMFGANFVWVSYNSILLLPLVQRVVAPEYSSLTVGVIAFFSTFVGITVSILTGIISDHSTSRWGRRGPAILIGALVGLPFIACAGIFHLSLPTIAISYLGMQFFTNIANGAWWPLLVDTVPENQRGLASGIAGFVHACRRCSRFRRRDLPERDRPGGHGFDRHGSGLCGYRNRQRLDHPALRQAGRGCPADQPVEGLSRHVLRPYPRGSLLLACVQCLSGQHGVEQPAVLRQRLPEDLPGVGQS